MKCAGSQFLQLIRTVPELPLESFTNLIVPVNRAKNSGFTGIFRFLKHWSVSVLTPAWHPQRYFCGVGSNDTMITEQQHKFCQPAVLQETKITFRKIGELAFVYKSCQNRPLLPTRRNMKSESFPSREQHSRAP